MSNWRSDLALALRSRAVWAGFIGSLLALLGSLSPAYLPQASPLWEWLPRSAWGLSAMKWTGTICTLLGLGLLLESWFRLRPSARRAKGRPLLRNWAVLLIISLPWLLSPPAFSHDAYSYVAHGWLIHNGLDPYLLGPGALPGHFADQVSTVWRDTPAPYGPLSLQISYWLVSLTGFDPLWSTLLHRVPALAGVGMIGYFVPRIASYVGVSRSTASWFATLNPILVIDFIGGMHNDSLMVGLMVLGVWLTLRYRVWALGAVAVGLATAIKQPALLAAVALPFLIVPWTSWRPKPLAVAFVKSVTSLAISLACFVGITFATGFGFGWIQAAGVPGKVDTFSPVVLIGRPLQRFFGWVWSPGAGDLAFSLVSKTFTVAMIVGIVWMAIKYLGKQPIRFVSWSLLWFALCAPALHSWYLLWGGVLFPMTRPSARLARTGVVVTVILFAYKALNFGERNGLGAIMLAAVVATYWAFHTHELRLNYGTDEEQPAGGRTAPAG